MLKKLLIALVAAIGLVAVVNYAAFSPLLECRAEHDRAVPPARLVEVAKDLRTWEKWSPWSKEKTGDTTVQFTYEGDPGEGMVWRWSGGEQLGDGSLTLTRVAEDGIDYRLALTGEFEMTMDAGLTVAAREGGAHAEWWSKSENDFPVIGRLMNRLMKKSIEDDYLAALEGLEAFAAQAQ